ncbi:MAG: hypothetical protein JSR91_13790 [Proteobacteria bacterium]|nr:hypothetical protein [Pseudomonadota bacterium]
MLVLLAAASGPLTPVQLQKAAFLVQRQAGWLIKGTPFSFEPYDYGPFDRGVYVEAEALATNGDVVVAPHEGSRWNMYSATAQGQAKAQEILEKQSPKVRSYLANVSKWVRSQSFSGLVKSIYAAYPDMKVNSVFQG